MYAALLILLVVSVPLQSIGDGCCLPIAGELPIGGEEGEAVRADAVPLNDASCGGAPCDSEAPCPAPDDCTACATCCKVAALAFDLRAEGGAGDPPARPPTVSRRPAAGLGCAVWHPPRRSGSLLP